MPRRGLSRFLAHSVLVVAVSGLVVGVTAVTPAVAAQQNVASAGAVTQQASVTTVSARADVASAPVVAPAADVWVIYARGLKFQDCYNIGQYLVDLGEAAAFKCIAQGSFFTLVILVPPICVAALPAAKPAAPCP